jgi:hypothetical protein
MRAVATVRRSQRGPVGITKSEADAIVSALVKLMELRGSVPHRGRGWWKLNNAMVHLDDRFWAGVGIPQQALNARKRGVI